MPDYVSNYFLAKWWLFTHIGLPLLVLLFVFVFVARVAEWREDMSSDDEAPSFENDLRVTPKDDV